MVALKSASECNIQTPEEVAQFLRKSPSWVYKHWQELGGRKLGGSLFFPNKEDLYERIFHQGQGVEVRSTPQRNPIHQGWVSNQKRGQRGQSKKMEGANKSKLHTSGGNDRNRHNLLGPGNLRLDYVEAYNSESHYLSYKYLARRWVRKWGDLMCSEITLAMVQQFFLERRKISAYTANNAYSGDSGHRFRSKAASYRSEATLVFILGS